MLKGINFCNRVKANLVIVRVKCYERMRGLLNGRRVYYFFLDKKVTKNQDKKNASAHPAIFDSGTAESKMSIPAYAGPLFCRPRAQLMN